MVKSALWIPRRHSADDDSLLAYAMKIRLIIAFLLMWFALPVHAEGTVSSSQIYTANAGTCNNPQRYAPAEQWCSEYDACRTDYNGLTFSNGACRDTSGGAWVFLTLYSTSCPANSTQSGSTCTCNSGFVPSGSSCIVSPPPSSCVDKIGLESPHVYADGLVVPATACFEGCSFNVDVGAVGSTFWVGWGQYNGNTCTGSVAPAPAPTPDSCPAGKALQGGVCTPLVDIPALGYGGMSISDIQKALAKSLLADAAKKTAAEKLVTPVYTSPDSIPSAPSIQDLDKKKAVEESGSGGRDSARDQGGSGDTQIISGELGAGFGSIVTTLKDIFGGNVAGASVNGAQIDLIVQPTTKEIAVTSLTPVAVAHAQAVCPSTNITLQGHPAVWTYTTECNFATSIRPILLAFAWLSATFILVGGIKNG